MAKKSRRAKVKSKVAETNQRPAVPSSQSKAAAVAPSKNNNRQAAPVAVFKPVSYDYVKSDLITIGIIAGALILIIVILTFIPALRT